jgi:hypothetical protein
MSLPAEYVIEDAVRTTDDLIVYRASHPIHGTVNVYLPDDSLPSELVRAAKRRLYQDGLRMRNLSLLNVPLTAKALEVSQNPNEPYIVTQCAEHDLEEFISNGLTARPKRMFTILSQVLEAIVNLGQVGWAVDRIFARQVKLPQLHTGDISFAVIEGTGRHIDGSKRTAVAAEAKPGDRTTTAGPGTEAPEGKTAYPTVRITGRTDEPRVQQAPALTGTGGHGVDRTAGGEPGAHIEDAQEQSRTRQRNIYLIGKMTYQLLFGRKYHASDEVAGANIAALRRKWRKVLEKALSQDIDCRYDTYEAMLRDVTKALNRNKTAVMASVPFLLLLALIGSYFAYERYHRYQIMTSEAGQAIESFLDIVNKTSDEFPELAKPEPAPSVPDDQAILSPFEKMEAIGDE